MAQIQSISSCSTDPPIVKIQNIPTNPTSLIVIGRVERKQDKNQHEQTGFIQKSYNTQFVLADAENASCKVKIIGFGPFADLISTQIHNQNVYKIINPLIAPYYGSTSYSHLMRTDIELQINEFTQIQHIGNETYQTNVYPMERPNATQNILQLNTIQDTNINKIIDVYGYICYCSSKYY